MADPTILVIYSCPPGLDKLRLDREHRRIDLALQQAQAEVEIVRRKHASTVLDIGRELTRNRYSVVQFSGHGQQDGIYVESDDGRSGEFLAAERLARLLRETQTSLAALLLISCYSSEMLWHFRGAAAYVITVHGEAADDSAIEFCGLFYEEFIRTSSVTAAYQFASRQVDDTLRCSLYRKSDSEFSPYLLTIRPSQFNDPLFVDLTQATSSIEWLGVSRDSFCSLLSRKVRIHRWIFVGERESIVIPVGGFFAMFSWSNAADIIRCHRVLKPKSGLPVDACELLADIIVSYNDVYLSAYRRLRGPINESTAIELKRGLDHLHRIFEHFFKSQPNFERLSSIDPDFMRHVRANCWANLQKADEKYIERDYKSSVIFAETALSCFHDTVDELICQLCD